MRIIVYIVVIFFPLLLKAQSVGDTISYFGTLSGPQLDNTLYNLRIVIKKDNTVLGYSISDPNTETETKSKILGTYIPKTKRLKLDEVKVLRSKQSLDSTEFCLLHMEGKFDKKLGMPVIEGSFYGTSNKSNDTCVTGSINLVKTEKLLNTLEKFAKKHDKKVSTANSKSIDLVSSNSVLLNCPDPAMIMIMDSFKKHQVKLSVNQSVFCDTKEEEDTGMPLIKSINLEKGKNIIDIISSQPTFEKTCVIEFKSARTSYIITIPAGTPSPVNFTLKR